MLIYKTTNIINGKIYIGQDAKENPNYYGSGTYLKRAINKYGKDNFKKDILIDGITDKDVLDRLEIFLIYAYNSRNTEIGYNLCKGGGGSSGRIISEENRIKLSIARKGKKLSKEIRENISKGQIGKKLGPHTEETKNKISNTLKGHIPWNKGLTKEINESLRICGEKQKCKIVTKETKIKQSNARKGKEPWNKGLKIPFKSRPRKQKEE